MRKKCSQIQPGDILLCYITGVKHWVGALEAIGPSQDKSKIWKYADFPERIKVKTLIDLDPEYGVPLQKFEGMLIFYENAADRGGYKGFLRGSPNRFKRTVDGETILEALKQAKAKPVKIPVDPKKLAKKPSFLKKPSQKGSKVVKPVVSVPAQVEIEETTEQSVAESSTQHTEIQYHLLRLGAQMGLRVWVVKNDRNRSFEGQVLGDLPGNVSELPAQFNDATIRTIELIDVLWLGDNSIVAAFEVEATTSVYSGLLRMSDLLALQPNLNLNLFLVATDSRRAKVRQEISRPTFTYLEKPLPEVCGFVSFERLMEKVKGISKLGLASSLRPNFLKTVAEYFDDTASLIVPTQSSDTTGNG